MKSVNMKQNITALKERLGANFKGVISQSFLRAEIELVNSNGVYELDFRNAKGNKALTEFLLKENDLFEALEVRFALAVKDSANPAVYVKQTYPNAVVFENETALATPGTFVTEHLESFYNAGTLKFIKGDTTYLPALPLTDARFVGQTQQTSATNKTSTEHGAYGSIGLHRPITLVGTDIGMFTINVPAPGNLMLQYTPTATGHATKKVIAILELHGLLATGGNKINTAAASEA